MEEKLELLTSEKANLDRMMEKTKRYSKFSNKANLKAKVEKWLTRVKIIEKELEVLKTSK